MSEKFSQLSHEKQTAMRFNYSIIRSSDLSIKWPNVLEDDWRRVREIYFSLAFRRSPLNLKLTLYAALFYLPKTLFCDFFKRHVDKRDTHPSIPHPPLQKPTQLYVIRNNVHPFDLLVFMSAPLFNAHEGLKRVRKLSYGSISINCSTLHFSRPEPGADILIILVWLGQSVRVSGGEMRKKRRSWRCEGYDCILLGGRGTPPIIKLACCVEGPCLQGWEFPSLAVGRSEAAAAPSLLSLWLFLHHLCAVLRLTHPHRSQRLTEDELGGPAARAAPVLGYH